ncbi:MAG: glycosyltransferase family 1 protein [Xanthobacteraceae bacterium]
MARFALARRPEITLSYYDKATGSFLAVNPAWAEHIISWEGAVGRRRHHLLRLVPSPYAAVGMLERLRSSCAHHATARAIAYVQRGLLRLRRRRRRGVVPFHLAIGGPLTLGPGDVILSTGSDWTNKDAAAILALKRAFGFRYAVMCHDIIPLILPRYFLADDIEAFRRYWDIMLASADLILVYSQCTARDVKSYCDHKNLPLSGMRLVRLGCDAVRSKTELTLPERLERDHFILYVSTIEPRKGHDLLLRVWGRLLADGIPQRHGFKLVFVGRRGWQADAVLRELDDAAAFEGTLMHLAGIGDDDLAALYRGAAFCVYPSLYEGLGLPVIEAFLHKKPVIASSGGALPETVGALSPCLDPTDEAAWYETLKQWIGDPRIRLAYETKIAAGFSPLTWEQAASDIFASLREAQPSKQN